MTPTQATHAALLIDNIREIEDFLDKRAEASDSRDVYITAAMSRTDANIASLRLKPEQIGPVLRMVAAQLRVELTDLGVE